MLKQIARFAISHRTSAAVIALAIALGGCGVKGPLVPPPNNDAAATPPAAEPSPLIRDPTQPERRP